MSRGAGVRSFRRSAAAAAISLALSIGLVEAGFRLADFDFEFKRRALERTPIFYRQPLVAMDDGLFRRPGPAQFQGQVITPQLERYGVPEALRPPEPEVAVYYDRQGFRNPPDLESWEVVVAGDSFTELGHLGYPDLFTTRLGARLSVRVKNLGTSYTGPFSYVSYLRHFGGSAAARHAVLAFFEGNDLGDLDREWRQLREAQRRRARGLPPPEPVSRLDALVPQSSFLKAVHLLLTGSRRPAEGHLPNAAFAQGERHIPVSVTYTPPSLERVSARVRELLGRALTDWAEAAAASGMKPWLLFLPCKRRVLHEWLVFAPGAPADLRRWSPNRLPDQVGRMAELRGIAFVDATPHLKRGAAAGRLPYNSVWDTHLNAWGAELVAEALAEALGPFMSDHPPSQAPPPAGAQGKAPLSTSARLP